MISLPECAEEAGAYHKLRKCAINKIIRAGKKDDAMDPGSSEEDPRRQSGEDNSVEKIHSKWS